MLSPVRLETLIAIHEFEVRFGFTPSYIDLRMALGIPHGTLQGRLRGLSDGGYITSHERQNRSRQITSLGIDALKAAGKYQSATNPLSRIPCLGEIAAGYISDPATHEEFLELAQFDPDKHFSLKVSGDSMIGVGIHDRATVVFERVPDGYEPKPGQIVAAYVEGLGTTLKRFYRKGKTILLEAANPNYPTQTIDSKQTFVRINGIWTGMTIVDLA
jgi:repressor LexA